MAIARGKVVDVKEEVFSKVSESDILYFYLGITHLPIVICSPLRKDTNPSLGLHYNKSGHIVYKDFATGEGGSLYTLLMKVLNLSFGELMENIYLNLVESTNCTTSTPILQYNRKSAKSAKKSSVVDIQVALRPWKPWDREYWSSYGITKEFLKFGKVFPVSHIFLIREDESCTSVPAEKHAYVYIEEKDNKISLKVYQPFSKDYKWINKHTSDVWDLWQQLPLTGDYLIITSSRKDALCIWCNTGIPSCSLQAESYLPKESVINELKGRFKNIFILYDNDFSKPVNHGREYGKTLASTFGLPQIELPEELGAKDSSDLYQLHGREVLRDTIFKLTSYEQDQTCPF